MLQKEHNSLPCREPEAYKSLLKEYQEEALKEKIIPEKFSKKSSFHEELNSESTNDTSHLVQEISESEESADNETTN